MSPEGSHPDWHGNDWPEHTHDWPPPEERTYPFTYCRVCLHPWFTADLAFALGEVSEQRSTP